MPIAGLPRFALPRDAVPIHELVILILLKAGPGRRPTGKEAQDDRDATPKTGND